MPGTASPEWYNIYIDIFTAYFFIKTAFSALDCGRAGSGKGLSLTDVVQEPGPVYVAQKSHRMCAKPPSGDHPFIYIL